jgi:L-rhamnose isomerase/sugar isomerase
MCEQILQAAFQSDVRPLLAEARFRSGGSLDPISFFRAKKIRSNLITKRGKDSVATGL